MKMQDSLNAAFSAQANTCRTMDSPFMGRLLDVLASDWPQNSALGRKCATFSGDIGPAGHSLPLRIAGGLHALVLSGQAPELAQVYPPETASDTALRSAIVAALTAHEPFLVEWINSPPQTNEVRRSAALIAGAHVAHAHFDLPIALSELGASGGLNLTWDHYALDIAGTQIGADTPVLTLRPEWKGTLPPRKAPTIATRAGVDLNPLDPRDPQDLLRLTAYLWADQPQRLALTKAAATLARGTVETADAIDWLAPRLSAAPDGHLHLIQHTVAWQYFPQEAQTRGRALIEAAGAKATARRPLAWLSMETDGDTTGQVGAALTLRLWPGDLTLHLGRADFHGRWIDWHGWENETKDGNG